MEFQGTPNNQNNLKKKKKVENLKLPDFKTLQSYYDQNNMVLT